NDPQPAVHYDIEATARPQGAGWDIGAFEYVGGPAPPVAEFSGNPRVGNAPLTVYFTDLSSGNPTSWYWTFGDGGESYDQHPVHEYQTVNSYTVSLTAENAQGQDTETKIGYITVTDQNCHVGAIDMANAGPPNYKAGATITVHDQDCVALAGVTVDITWSGAATGSDSDVTDEYGQVTFVSERNKAGGTFTCCVDNLTKDGYPYNSGANHETCDSITLP
ncbi:MAG: PKD domain-containing protein, partial [Armatimonadota bacterium]